MELVLQRKKVKRLEFLENAQEEILSLYVDWIKEGMLESDAINFYRKSQLLVRNRESVSSKFLEY